mmetsp:Transcript_28998/g.72639  ORF Transcript_28998/g.72639 Transcript_28998/m.72639 type:complete len:241 (+) Transcript_28998:290-1012(+)
MARSSTKPRAMSSLYLPFPIPMVRPVSMLRMTPRCTSGLTGTAGSAPATLAGRRWVALGVAPALCPAASRARNGVDGRGDAAPWRCRPPPSGRSAGGASSLRGSARRRCGENGERGAGERPNAAWAARSSGGGGGGGTATEGSAAGGARLATRPRITARPARPTQRSSPSFTAAVRSAAVMSSAWSAEIPRRAAAHAQSSTATAAAPTAADGLCAYTMSRPPPRMAASRMVSSLALPGLS